MAPFANSHYARGAIEHHARQTPTIASMRLDRRELAAIFLGGAAGALLRVWLGETYAAGPAQWPWAIFAVNVTGSFALGYLATRLQERLPLSTYWRPLLGTGFCGAYTTFSTMQVEILIMLDHHRYGLAVGYAGASIAAGYIALHLATATVRRTRVIA
jgi:fluoride exporter